MMKSKYKLIMLLFMLFSISSSAQNMDTIVVKGTYWHPSGSFWAQLSNYDCGGSVYNYPYTITITPDSTTGIFQDTIFVPDSLSTGLVRIYGGTRTYDLSKSYNEVIFDANTQHMWGYNPRVYSRGLNTVFDHSYYIPNSAKDVIWDFGDGTVDSTSDTNIMYHTYTNPGRYDFTVSFYDSTGKVYTNDSFICIDANFGSCNDTIYTSIYTNNPKKIYAISGDNYVSSKFYKIDWDFGDGNTQSGSSRYVQHTYSQDGKYQVCASYQDSLGCSYTACDSVNICGLAFTSSNPISTANNQKDFDFSVGVNNSTGVTYEWDFGDGSAIDTSKNPSHTFGSDTIYIVKVTIKSSVSSCEIQATKTIDLRGCSFTASYTYSETSIYRYNFIPSVDTAVLPLSYEWYVDNKLYSTQSTFGYNHTSAPTGYQKVCVIVTNGYCTNEYCDSIYICGIKPSLNARMAGADSITATGYVGGVIDSTAQYTYSWYVNNSLEQTGTSINFEHKLTTSGTYEVCFEVDPKDSGCMQRACQTLDLCIAEPNFSVLNDTLDSFTFAIDSASSLYTYTWSVDGISKGTGQTFGYDFGGDGLYQVCAKVSPHDSGCLEERCYNIKVCKGSADFYTTNVSQDSMHFYINKPISAYTYTWSVDGVTIGTGAAIGYKFNTDGNHSIKVEVSPYDSVCDHVKVKYITVCRGNSQFDIDRHTDDSLTFAMKYPYSGYTYEWFLNNVSIGTGASIDYKANDGTYTIRVQVSPSDSLCDGSSQKTFTVCSGRPNFKTTEVSIDSFNFKIDSAVSSYIYTWKLDGVTVGTGTDFGYKFTSGGTYTICAEMSPSDSICDPVFCTTINVCLVNANYTVTPGAGNSRTFTALHTSPGYIYVWNFGDGTRDSGSSVVSHTYTASGQYITSLTIYDPVSGCYKTVTRVVNYNHPNGLCLSGNIMLDSFGTSLSIDSAIVYLIEYDSVAGTLTAIDSVYLTDIDSNHYKFCGLMQGKYLIKAALLSGDPSYNDNIPTYYQSSTQWSGATEINAWHTMGGRNIWMVGGTNPGGPGFIGGLISAGANKTNNLDELIITILLKDANGKPIAYREMDANHKYSFDGLPYGTYKLAIDIPGKTTAEYIIVLTPTSPKKDDADFIVKSTNILTSVKTKPFTISNNVYPNPASDEVKVDLDIKGTHTITLELVDMQGRVVATTTYNNASGANTFTLVTKEVQAGVYMLKIKADDFSTVNKIIINK